ncbi:MAG: hypothetical protein ACRDQ2_06660 [Gaiellales bacterium]
MQSDPDEALDVLYRLRENWTTRAEAGAQVILRAIESLIAEYEASRDTPDDG